MESLLQPQLGLMVWTWLTFLALLFVLMKFAWKPILEGVNAREVKIKGDLERAEKSQKEAEALRVQFEQKLAEAQRNIQQMMNEARSDADRSRTQLLDAARAEAQRLVEKGRQELTGETSRLKAELQKEVGNLSVSIAEKILQKSIDQKVQAQVLDESLKTVQGAWR